MNCATNASHHLLSAIWRKEMIAFESLRRSNGLGSCVGGRGARSIAELGLDHLVLVDDDGVAVGMVSALDFVRALVGYVDTSPIPI